MPDRSAPPGSLLALDELRVERDGRTVLDGVSLRVLPGERVVVMGAIGAGKSTLLLASLGLVPRTAGRIALLGRDCEGEDDFAPLRGPVGLLFQDPDDQLLGPSVLEDVEFGPLNLGLGAAAAHAAADAALEQVGLLALAARPVHALSGGEKRLVALAGLLAMRPRLLLLDEPTAALDPPSAVRVLEVLARSGLPLLVASHDPLCVDRLATRTLVLRAGRLGKGESRAAGAADRDAAS